MFQRKYHRVDFEGDNRIEAFDTHPKLLKWWYEKFGDKMVCQLKKDFGIWQRYTWGDYYYQAKYFSLALISLGFKWGDRMAIIGDNEPEWAWAQIGAQAAGGIAVGIYTDCTPSEIRYIIEHSEPTIVVAGDQEQVDKILEIKNELPMVKKVIYWKAQGLIHYDDPMLINWSRVLELGREYEKKYPGLFEENVAKGKGSDQALILYTSGTSGIPKGVMRTHRSLIEGAKAWAELYSVTWQDERVSFFPPAWILEQHEGISLQLWAGQKMSYPETVDTANADLRERGPTSFSTAARIWDGMVSEIQVKIADSGMLQRFCYNMFLPVGYKVADFKLGGKSVSLLWRVLYAVANLVLFRCLRDRFGLSRVKRAYTSGALVSPDTFRFFIAMGVPLMQIYGLTEMAPVTGQREEVDPITSGPTLPGCYVKISNDGEILVRGISLFSGYYNNPELTKKNTVDGWFCTGDAGFINEKGHLVVMDRVTDLVELPGGKKFSPQFIESRLRFSPYIRDAVVIGGKEKPFVSALMVIDLANVGKWAEKRNIAFTTFSDLAQKPQVYDLILNEITKVNRGLPKEMRVRKFVNFYKELDPDEAEVTRTRKIRRSFLESRYAELIKGMYGNEQQLSIEAEVKYRDGRQMILKTTLHARECGEEG
jgi:long-chain acyl-CoA synthetase